MSGAMNAHDFHVCEYQGRDNHLCMFEGNQELGYARGHGMILNDAYETVATVQSGNGRPPNDQHEFNVLPGGETALVSIYNALEYDLSAFGITSGQGWIMEVRHTIKSSSLVRALIEE